MPARAPPHSPRSANPSGKAADGRFISDKQTDRNHDRTVAQTIALGVIVLIGLVVGFLGWLTFERPARREAQRRRRMSEFGDALQVARTEREAFGVLRRHIEHWLDQARAVVL